MKARIKFSKKGNVKFVGHLDLMRFFQKAIKRADLDIAYSEGFSPHQIMSFASPLGVGVTSDGEYADIELNSALDSKTMVEKLNAQMVDGLEIKSIKKLSDKEKNAMSVVTAADYLVNIKNEKFTIEDLNKLKDFVSQDNIFIIKKSKKKEVETDIKSMIYEAELKDNKIFLKLKTGSVSNLKPELFMKAFSRFLNKEFDGFSIEINRIELYDLDLKPLEDAGEDII